MNEVQQQRTTNSNTGNSGRIMLVDDNADDLRTLKTILDAQGYETFAAINGKLALDAMKQVCPDLILLDILMPEMSGYEICRQLKTDEKTQDIPVLFVSALGESMDKVQAFDVGGVDYISKPFETEEVLARIRTHIELYQMRHNLEQMVASRTHALQESEEKYRRLVEGLKDEYFFYVHDIDGVFSYLSPSIKQVLGYAPEEFMLHYAEYFTDNPINQQATKNTERSIRGEQQPVYEVEIFSKDRKKCWLEVKETPVLDNAGKVIAVEGIAHNVTEKKQQQEQLRRNEKMDALGKLTGGIAHDFNNMLGVILGYSEILNDALSNDPKLHKYVDKIYRAGERCRKLTSKLLAFSRKETTSAEMSDINTVIQDQQHLLEKTLTARIKLVIKLAENIWPVWLDKGSLGDAILNMSINALHAMPDGGTFTLDTRNASLGIAEAQQMDIEPGDYVLLSLTDTGIGMDETTQQQIFDPFFSTKGDKGTGLGMSQVYGFVKQSRGTIRLHSEPGQGTQFTIYFPRCVESRAVNSVQGAVDSVEVSAGNETILVVDDEAAIRELSREILVAHGYRVLCAEDGEQALEVLETNPVDLLLTDVIMPGMDGYQLASKVERRYPQIIIQIVTGFSDNYHVGQANEELHQQRLQKPLSSDALLQRIRKLLDERAEQTQDMVKLALEFDSLNPVEWSEEFSTGIHEIDADHKVMISLVNRCLDVINNGSEDRKEIQQILDSLLDYKDFHFQREECIMKVCGYPDLTKHQQLHQILTDEVEEKVKEYGFNKLTTKLLLEFLVGWLRDHVRAEDKLIAAYCKGKENLIEQALVDLGLNNPSNDD